MKKNLLFLISIFFTATLFAAEAIMSNLPVERFALYVGCNDGGKSREQLLYAGSDAYNFQKTMAEIGGVPASNSQLLINPDKDDIIYALNGFSARIEKRKEFTKRTEFIFYYSGHSDEDSLLLGTSVYDYSSLKAAITEVPSDVHVVILDSCFSGNFIRAKGGKRSQAFLTDDSTIVQGHAYLSSSSSSESSQESDEIQSSFFTNAMLTGLRGAADTSHDNKVSLNELYYYAFNETLSKTENSVIGPQHPSYNITLVGSGDLILTDISQAESTVVIPKDDSGKFIFRNSRGVLVSEINKLPGNQVSIALESDDYEVTMIGENSTKQGKFTLKKNDTYVVSTSDMKSIKRVKNTVRGDEQVSDEKIDDDRDEIDDGIEIDKEEEKPEPDFSVELKVKKNKKNRKIDDGVEVDEDEFDDDFGFDEKFSDDSGHKSDRNLFRDADERHTEHSFKFGLIPPLSVSIPMPDRDVSIGVLVNHDEQICNFGFQIASLGNSVSGKMSGIQLGVIYNTAKSVYGIQQSVILNKTNDLAGAQIGLINAARNVKGIQIGLINGAGTLSGSQIGLINVGKKANGFVLGLFNFILDGVAEVNFYWNTEDLLTFQYKGGTKEFYTTFTYSGKDMYAGLEYFGYKNDFYAEIGTGFGTRILDGVFAADYEFEERIVFGTDYDFNSCVSVYSSLKTTVSLNFGFIGAMAGFSLDFLSGNSDITVYNLRCDDAIIHFGSSVDLCTTLYWGFKINF